MKVIPRKTYHMELLKRLLTLKFQREGLIGLDLRGRATSMGIGYRRLSDFWAHCQNRLIHESTLDHVCAWIFGVKDYTWVRYSIDHPSPSIVTQKFKDIHKDDRDKIENKIIKDLKKYSIKPAEFNLSSISTTSLHIINEVKEVITKNYEELKVELRTQNTLKEYKTLEAQITKELETKHKEEKDMLIKEWELSVERVKELQKKMKENMISQPVNKSFKDEVNSLIKQKKYKEAEPLLYYLLLKQPENGDFNFQFASLKVLQLKYLTAYTYYRKACELNPNNASYLNRAGCHCIDLRKYQEAIKYFSRVLEIDPRICDVSIEEKTHSYINLGAVWNYLDDYKKSIGFYNKALKIALDFFGNNHSIIATIYSNISFALIEMGDYHKAYIYIEWALEIRFGLYGPNHSSIALSYDILAMNYKKNGKFQEAFEYYKRALEIRLKRYGRFHHMISVSYNNLASISSYIGDNRSSLKYYQKALTLQIRIFGRSHPKIAEAYSNIGIIFQQLHEYKNAVANYKKALAICKKQLGISHPLTRSIQSKLPHLNLFLVLSV